MAQQKHHWKEALPGEYLGAYSLNGQDLVVTIQSAAKEIVTGANGKKEECLVIRFKEQVMDMVCNRTNAKTITKVLGTPYLEDWSGKKIQLYPTTTKFGGEVVDCIRVRPSAPKQSAPILCERCGQPILPAGNMTAEQIAEYGVKTFGKKLCSKCGRDVRAEADKKKEMATEGTDA